LLVLPVALLLYPLVRGTPDLYGFVMRRRVSVWYRRIRQVELELDQYNIAELDDHLAELEGMEQEVTETVSVSTDHLAAVYSLRQHIRVAIEGLRKRKANLEAAEAKRDTAIDNSAWGRVYRFLRNTRWISS
jgi:hypothetical protein